MKLKVVEIEETERWICMGNDGRTAEGITAEAAIGAWVIEHGFPGLSDVELRFTDGSRSHFSGV